MQNAKMGSHYWARSVMGRRGSAMIAGLRRGWLVVIAQFIECAVVRQTACWGRLARCWYRRRKATLSSGPDSRHATTDKLC